MPGGLACLSNKRNAAERFLHHPFEVTSQKAIYQEDVKRTLMVGYKDVRLVGFDQLVVVDLNRE